MNNLWLETEVAPLDLFGFDQDGEDYGEESESYYDVASGFDEEDYSGEEFFPDDYGEDLDDYVEESLYERETDSTESRRSRRRSRWLRRRARARRYGLMRARARRRARRFRMSPEEAEAFEMMDEETYSPEGDILVDFPEYEPDLFDDSEELAEALREVLDENYRDASSEEMEEALFNILETMTLAEGFSFKKLLSRIIKPARKVLKNPVVGKIARKVLPAAGAAIGTVYGGPLGTAVGGKLGQVAGQAFSGGRKPSRTGRPGGQPPTPAQGGSPAAAQLLQLTQNPDMLKSLMALALGSHGKKSIQVGQNGPAVPVGGFLNLLGALVNKAASDADELSHEGGEESAYLRDSEGDFRVDPYVPEERAQILYEMLSDAENQRSSEEAAFYTL